MSIASRIEQIEQHLTDDYSVLELAGADLTNVDKNIQNLKQSWEERLLYFLANGTDTLWNNWEKVSESGTEISLNNTIEAKMEFIYKGNTSQTGTPTPDTPIPVQVVSGDNTIKVEGANLVSSYRNATGTGQFWAALYVKANLKPNAFYEMSFIDNSTGNGYTRNENLAASVSSYSIISNGERQYYSFKTKDNISPDGNGEYLIFKNNKAQSQAPQFTNVDIREVAQLTTESFDYEPYVSQTYPINLGNIELCKIGDYQDKIAKSSGKNLCNLENLKLIVNSNGVVVTNNAYWNVIIDTRNENSIYIKGNYSLLQDSVLRIGGFNEYPQLNSQGTRITYSGSASLDTSTYNYVLLCFGIGDNHTIDEIRNSFMVNYGSTALPYEPYGKVWYLNKQIGKVVLDGSENWSLNESGTGYSRYALTNNTATTNYSDTIVAMSDKFIGSKDTDVINADADANRICIVSNHRFIIKTIDNNLLTLQAFKTWLSAHNTTVYYVLATPTNTEITDTTLISQLEAIKKSYNTKTNISQENNDLPFELDVVALGKLS